MDLSLDDIIKTKKIGGASKKPIAKKALPLRRTLQKTIFKAPITDARNKIIQKNRAKIRDARDKLAEITRASGDARQKLLQKQQKLLTSALKNEKTAPFRNGRINNNVKNSRRLVTVSKPTAPIAHVYHRNRAMDIAPRTSRMPEIVEVPRGYVDYDNMERMEEEEYAAATRLSRTVKNDIGAYNAPRTDKVPPAPRRLNSWGSSSDHFDPFDVYKVPHGRHERRISPDLPPPPPKSILRPSIRQHSPDDLYERRYIPQPSSHLSYEMRSRLERAPDPHASVGIFANPLKSNLAPQSSSGYRIVVSNLHTSVTQSDIRELFEDIGELYDSHIVRPGVAEVIYKSLGDAEKAVDTYHNRQLDGQPMKCMLVNPRASNKPTAPAAISTSSSNSRNVSGKTPLEIDIDALHKVLFRRH